MGDHMTMTATSNGHGSTADRVRQLWERQPGLTAAEVGRQLDIPRETAGYHLRKLRAEVDGKGAATAAGSVGVAAVVSRQSASPSLAPTPRPPQSRPRQPTARPRRRDLVKDVGVVTVAAVMLAVSYNHIVHLALLAGCGWWAWVMPLPLDGMAVVSIRHLRHERRYWVAWAGIIIGLGGSLVANVVAFDPTLADMRHVGWAFAALPPLAVAVCLHLFDRGNREGR